MACGGGGTPGVGPKYQQKESDPPVLVSRDASCSSDSAFVPRRCFEYL